MEQNGGEWVQRRAFLFSHPRTASNLLTRMLSGQTQWRIANYQFFDAFHYGREHFSDVRKMDDVEADKRSRHDILIEQGRRKLKDSFDSAAREVGSPVPVDSHMNTNRLQQKHCLVKNHAFMVMPAAHIFERQTSLEDSKEQATKIDRKTNPTIFSDDELFSWQPIILIRNPIAVYESWLRAEGDPSPDLDSVVASIYTTFKHQRRVFDWYHENVSSNGPGSLPVVIDADDLIEDPEVLHRLCSVLDMRTEEVLFQWDVETLPPELIGRSERLQNYCSTIRNSTGVLRDKSSRNLDLPSKKAAWSEMFGDEKAVGLAERVMMSWPDYGYLRAFKLVGSSAAT